MRDFVLCVMIMQATPEEISDQIFKFARKGMTPSQIGIVLRDSYGIPQVKTITGNKIVRILKTASEFTTVPSAARHEAVQRASSNDGLHDYSLLTIVTYSFFSPEIYIASTTINSLGTRRYRSFFARHRPRP